MPSLSNIYETLARLSMPVFIVADPEMEQADIIISPDTTRTAIMFKVGVQLYTRVQVTRRHCIPSLTSLTVNAIVYQGA